MAKCQNFQSSVVVFVFYVWSFSCCHALNVRRDLAGNSFRPRASFDFGVGWTPNWDSTYQMNHSTIFMPCNYSGLFDPTFAAQFGVADFDWSNGKSLWADASPMDCEELLVSQAQLTKSQNPSMKVFIYRNLVKALPWFSSVREKLLDPNYAGWFLRFNPLNTTYHVPECTGSYCSSFYHDQDQTPSNPTYCDGVCNCGTEEVPLPCGEYLFDHRNTSLREWIVSEFMLGPTGMGSPYVDGFYIDDGWANTSQPVLPWEPAEGFCDHSPIGGATEEDYYCTADMGLTQEDTTALKEGWEATMQAVFQALVDNKGFSWSQWLSTSTPSNATCSPFFQSACQATSAQQTSAMLYTYTLPEGGISPLPQFDMDLASFLLVRGPYGFLGYSWVGCSSGDEPPGAGGKPYEYPSELNLDYGVPLGLCSESSPGVFTRKWSKAAVTVDCNTYESSIVMNPSF